MDTTFAELKRRVIRVIGDEVNEPGSGSDIPLSGMQTSAELLQDAVDAALDAICTRYPKSLTFEVTGDTTFELPTDYIDVEGVLLASGYMLPQLQLLASTTPIGNEENAWDTYTEGLLTFQTSIAADTAATVYYSATWTKPTDDSSPLEPPSFMIMPLTMYAAHYVIFYSASQASSLAQYKTKVDSGSPTDNPLMDLANFFLKHYEIEMQRVPMKPKGRKV